MAKSIRQEIIGVLSDVLCRDEGEITDEKRMREDLSCDSLDILDMLFKLEEKLGFHVKTEEMKNVETVGQVIEKCEELQLNQIRSAA